MSSLKKTYIFFSILFFCLIPFFTARAIDTPQILPHTLAEDTLAKELGWVACENQCGGFYLEEPLVYSGNTDKANSIEITGNEGLWSQHGTSILEGKVAITRYGQQMTANKAYLYRDPITGKLSAIDMIGNVHFREPCTLIIAKKGRYNFETKTKSLIDILYRTSINEHEIIKNDMPVERKITALTAWGRAYEFYQNQPRVYSLSQTSFSTCPPIHPAWQVKASHIVLNKNTGRGYATNARFLVKNLPIFYIPYISFSIDKQRKSGFLWPSYGGGNQTGPSIYAPFYWNMAPNYDMVVTPAFLSKRGVQITDNFRYLTHTSEGKINFSILPHDRMFANFQKSANKDLASIKPAANQDLSTTQAELNRLLNYSTTRKSFFWRDDSRFNEHWSSHLDFNYAGDDYYLQNFGNNLNAISQNQLLQEGDLYYKSEHWNFTGRLQAYQTQHPINEHAVINQYRRFPQLILIGDFPQQPFGLEYFIGNEIAHFEILKTPGSNISYPVGDRLHTQPGINLPLYWPYFYINPRFQIALTEYNLHQTGDTQTPSNIRRAVPIFDIASGLLLNRNTSFFGCTFQQTLEPQVYYTYIPYRNQSDIPIFDTSVNTLTYDQLFNYNRFSGIDRIGDANQIGIGVTTRLIDNETGLEKVRFGIGDIIYFANRRVTLCNDDSCTDNPSNASNHWGLSPISSLLNFNIIPNWIFTANAIWNPISKQLDNSTLALHYQTDNFHIINLGYRYARNGDILSGIATNTARDNLKVTDLSFSWLAIRDVSLLGRWSQSWNQKHLQNLLYGVQYDSCCWSVRMVGGRAFIGLNPNNNNKPLYNNEIYFQFSLKGLGNISTGNPSGLLSSISGYNTQFGQEF